MGRGSGRSFGTSWWTPRPMPVRVRPRARRSRPARPATTPSSAGQDHRRMAGGEHRPEQQEMCRAVAEAMVTGTHLVVQAGTGTGKSLAYLVPAALSGKKVVVATATKALQDQLADKDLPLVDAGLGLPAPLDYAVLKGRSNYLCRQRVAEVGSGGIQAELGDAGPAASRRARAVRGPSGEPGPTTPLPRAWSTRCATWWRGRRRRRPGTGPT